MNVDPRFLTGDGAEIFNGSELLVKGALEAEGGVHLLGGYPGSPISDFFDTITRIKDLLKEKGIRAVINNNEALATAMLNGSQAVACRSMICMKSVGVHVAADALALGNLSGAHTDGGAIVVYGDDPWSDSTQVPADSRYISKHLHIPVVEPSNPQEIKDFVDLSFKVSCSSELYIGYMLTTNLADGGGSVQCRPNQYPRFNTNHKFTFETDAIDLDKRVLLPPRTWWQEESLPHRHCRAITVARELGLNRIDYPSDTRKPLGFVGSGLAHAYLVQALFELDMLGQFPVLKFGMSYPVDGELVRELAQQCERIIVVEERRGFLEEQIGEVLLEAQQSSGGTDRVELWGKKFPGNLKGIPATRGLHPSILIERLAGLLKSLASDKSWVNVPIDLDAIDREMRTIEATTEVDVGTLPIRLATFCPGCPHRDSSSLCLEIKKRFMDPEYMKRVHACPPVDLLFHGDTGCYSMLLFPPNTPLMHDYSGMGLGGGTGSGTDPFVSNKEVVFMGDSTFFHSGQIAISQAIKLGQDITFIILDNSTTAMTGHQPTPGVDYDVIGDTTPIQDIEDIVNGMSRTSSRTVVRADPEKREQYRELLEETFLSDGVKVVIATKECGITRMRRKRRFERAVIRRKGCLPTWDHMNINQEICRFCLTCAELTGCPGLKHVETDYGRKMDTDVTRCVDDGACERVRACSAFEHVTIRRKRPPRSRVPELGLDEIGEPEKREVGDLWRCCLTGVGGMGVGVATGILVRAAHNEGYKVIFVDKKGLAIRNGGILSQVVYNISDKPLSGIIPYGKADLLIGIDILEATRALDPKQRARIASPDRTAAVVNTDKVSTIAGLMRWEDFDVDELERTIRKYTRSDDYLARNISRICEKYLFSKQYTNIMMLGFAFQKGLIPVSMHSMAWAIKDTIRTDFRKNLYAFNMGRKLVVEQDLFQGPPQRTDWKDVLESKCRWTIRRYGKGRRLADQLRQLTAATITATAGLENELKRAIVVRTYDCMRWGGIEYAQRYTERVRRIYELDDLKFGYAATGTVVHDLAAAMLIKDDVFLAELSTSPEKYARDREKYNVNPANGDRIMYKRLWHPRVRFARKRLTLNVSPRGWMLQILKRSRWVRKVLPGWCKAQHRFLLAYEELVDNFQYDSPEDYHHRVRLLSSRGCMDCTNPLCSEKGCPLESEIPRWIELAYRGRWREASDLLHSRNNFPEFTAAICPAPCQDSCKQALEGHSVQIREVERSIVERALAEGWVTAQPPSEKNGKRVAVVGSGPAGLAGAQQLVRAGCDVTVFEKDELPGGLLRCGIPDFRLEKDLIDRRIEQLKDEGVEFRTGVTVGKDISGAELRERFDAVLLGTGASRSRDLDVPGRSREGIYLAVDYLSQFNRAGAVSVSAKDKVVAVIGGGLTGADCVEVAHRQGAREIHQLDILPKEEVWSAVSALMIDEPRERVRRRWCVSTRRFGGLGGGLGELAGVRVEWVPSENGRAMKEVPGSEFRIAVDMVLLALGFDPVVDPRLTEQLGIETDDRGVPIVRDFATTTEGVFAAGDLVTGPSYVVTAINSAREAAEKIGQFLRATVSVDA